MLKVLFISHFREDSGVGQAARDLILTMDSVGIDVVPRALKLNDNQPEIPERILELEEKSSVGCDYCVQFLLPHHLKYDGSFKKCVALVDYECWNFQDSGWPYMMNMFDEVWVPSEDGVEQTSESGVTQQIKVVPHAVDLKKFEQEYKPILGGDFIFYFIGDANIRKNLKALITAFHSEFDITEKVNLVIKTSKWGMTQEQCMEHIQGYIKEVKNKLKLYGSPEAYKSEIIITSKLSNEQLMGLHKSCNCFVMPSYGEAFCLPLADALGMGNPAICTNVGGMKDLVDSSCGWRIPFQLEPVNSMIDSFPDLYTAREQWASVDILELRNAMRKAFSTPPESWDEMRKAAKEKIKNFSYEAVGNLIRSQLE